MKKTIFISIILTISWVYTNAQSKISLTGGVNYSSVSSVNSSNPDGRIGLNAGIAYKRYINDLGWFIKPGLFYSQEGWLHQRLDYINLPFVAGFDFTEDFNFNIGLQYGYLAGGTNLPPNRFISSNYAFLIGFEFYPVKSFDVGLRFSNGFMNIIDEPDLVEDARTYNIHFYFGFNISSKE
ncbi:MAG: outer membrane beta-barrel protein [Bacteroidota bacterium]